MLTLRRLFVVAVVVFLMPVVIQTAEGNDCPSSELLEKEWVEHNGGWNEEMGVLLGIHFNSPLAPIKNNIEISQTAVNVDRGMGVTPWSEILWSVYRTKQTDFSGENQNCYLLGTVVYYVEMNNDAGWPPKFDYQRIGSSEKSLFKGREIALIEFRWYDPADKKRHRWFNKDLASHLQWVLSDDCSPLLLAKAINSLN